MASPSLPVLSGDKDQLLQQALGRLSASPKPGGADADPIVTATRRVPAVAASYAAFPEDADPRLVNALQIFPNLIGVLALSGIAAAAARK